MSNPAVIKLSDASSRVGRFKRFVLEDNIGESIHLHIDNMRIDFTINEFLSFSELIRESLKELDFLDGYSIDDFDESFLNECSSLLPKLKYINIEEISLSRLQCIVNKECKRNLNEIKILPISNTPAYKYLKENKGEFTGYKQLNYHGVNNEKRLLNSLGSIKKNGYPYQGRYLVLFNKQNLIRDGQHRAAILAHLYGLDYKVKVMRFYFSDDSHCVNVKNNNVISILKRLLKRFIRKLTAPF